MFFMQMNFSEKKCC
ncbi:unnamed protein product [Acanthoscelides obtectus]|uniref:Uncharacterized protein n=1 Tax=Acanthoscelides obtectus TaxID=200917 RepID=A0A9P0PFS5_ACAOB|nr:unnamed protein product [Acanthoscelides obtectus]